MKLEYDRSPGITEQRRLESLMESMQRALSEIEERENALEDRIVNTSIPEATGARTYCSAYRNGSYSVGSSPTKVDLTDFRVVSGYDFKVDSGNIIAQREADVSISAKAYGQGVYIFVNNVELTGFWDNVAADGNVCTGTAIPDYMCHLKKGDIITLKARNKVAGTVSQSDSVKHTYISIKSL